MALATFSVRMDENLKRQFEGLCEEFGMSATTAFNVFARAVVRERQIPFTIQAVDKVTREDAREAILAIREHVQKRELQDMTLEEINEEIRLARMEMEEKR